MVMCWNQFWCGDLLKSCPFSEVGSQHIARAALIVASQLCLHPWSAMWTSSCNKNKALHTLTEHIVLYLWHLRHELDVFPSSWTVAKSFFKFESIVYIHVYLLAVFFFPSFLGTYLCSLVALPPSVYHYNASNVKPLAGLCHPRLHVLENKQNGDTVIKTLLHKAPNA